VIRHGRDTEVFWAEGSGNPELVYGGEREKVGACSVLNFVCRGVCISMYMFMDLLSLGC
jgi:hypothetical protein